MTERCAECWHGKDYHGWLEDSDGRKSGICAAPPGDCVCYLFIPTWQSLKGAIMNPSAREELASTEGEGT